MKVISIFEFNGIEYRKGEIVKIKSISKEPVIGKLEDFCTSDIDLDCSSTFNSDRRRITTANIVSIERIDENEKVPEQSGEK